MRSFFQSTGLMIAVLMLSSCAFHLREQADMPFKTLYLEAENPKTLFIADLRRSLEANDVKLASAAAQADVILNIVFERPEKQILTLGGDGRVNEFRLSYKISLRAYDLKQLDWMPAEEIYLYRDFSYDDSIVLAKEAEEALLYQNMRSDMVQQIVRRLSRAKPQKQSQPK